MSTIEGMSGSSGEYTAASQAAEELKTPVEVAASVGATTGDEGISRDIIATRATTTGDSTKASAAEKLFEAVARVVTALVDLLTVVFSASRGDRPSVEHKPIISQPKPPTNPKPTVSAKPPIPAEKPTAKPSSVKGLEAIQDDRGVVTVRTRDGYTVRAEGREQAWTITAPDGKATRIYGDPHVKESDGDRWDFKRRGSFAFGANKVTVETVPIKNGNTVSSRITIYSGSERVTIGGLDKNRPTILALAGDGRQHDDALSDGDVFTRGSTKNGESWSVIQNGRRRVMGGK
jgi:hypothetical protein